jgi:hypothetical protein
MIFSAVAMVSIAVYNIFGVIVTKNINALTRSIADVTITSLIWGFGILMTVFSDRPNYKWELVSIWAVLFELIGFCLLVFGNLVNNQIVFKQH